MTTIGSYGPNFTRFVVPVRLPALLLGGIIALAGQALPLGSADAGAWRTTTFTYHGEAGEWLLVHQDLGASRRSFDFLYSADFRTYPTDGQPYAVFASAITPTWTLDTQFPADPTVQQYESNPIASARISEWTGPGASGCDGCEFGGGVGSDLFVSGSHVYCDGCYNATGFTFVIGATVPWSLNFSLTDMLSDSAGAVVSPDFVTHATGMAYVNVPAQTSALIPGIAWAHATIHTDTPGWSVIQYAESLGSDNLTIHSDGSHFANGERCGTAPRRVGYFANILASGTGYEGGLEACRVIQTQTDVSGTAEISLTTTGTGRLDHVSYLHLPMTAADFPPGVAPRAIATG